MSEREVETNLIKQTLESALVYVSQGWTQEVEAKDILGHGVSYYNSHATCWCVEGALRKAAFEKDIPWICPVNRVRNVIKQDQLFEWNDDPERTKADVLRALEQAIESCVV